MQILSDFGGILEIFAFLFVVFCTRFNEVQMLAKSIRAVYFQHKCEPNGCTDQYKLGPIKF
jgi:hypothetical protein